MNLPLGWRAMVDDFASWLPVCRAEVLCDGGAGVRFDVRVHNGKRIDAATAFAIRFDGAVRVYLNECQHVPVELDWQPGRFFDDSGLYLVCATHGALYEPDTGVCIGGPCAGRRLRALDACERHGIVYWKPDSRVLAPCNEPTP